MLTSDCIRQRLTRWQRRSRELCWRVAGKCRERITVSTRQGRLTVFTSDQVIGHSLYVNREFEAVWVQLVLSFLRATQRLPPRGRGTVLDIGANMGVISIGMLCQKEFARAVAIEPDPRNYSLLVHNARQNCLPEDRYRALCCGASDREGTMEFELSSVNFGDHRVRIANAAADSLDRCDESQREVIRVPVDTIDNLLVHALQPSDEVSLVWIDTQGHEGHVFAGGKQLFARDIPVFAEFWPYGIQRSGLSQREFIDIAASYWAYYWVWCATEFVRYPINQLSHLFAELGDEGNFDNILLTKN